MTVLCLMRNDSLPLSNPPEFLKLEPCASELTSDDRETDRYWTPNYVLHAVLVLNFLFYINSSPRKRNHWYHCTRSEEAEAPESSPDSLLHLWEERGWPPSRFIGLRSPHYMAADKKCCVGPRKLFSPQNQKVMTHSWAEDSFYFWIRLHNATG